MENKGLEITFNDGTKEYYDPVSHFFLEDGFGFSFYVGGYDHTFSSLEVKDIRWYDLCEVCGYEIYEDGCRNCKDI